MFKLVRSDFMVPPDKRLPGGWIISTGGYPVSPMPTGRDLAQLINVWWQELSKEDHNDP
jgi:hypothetical protein